MRLISQPSPRKTLNQTVFSRCLWVMAIATGMTAIAPLAPATAQFNNADALKDPNQQNSSPFSNSGSSSNPIFDLIHRASLGSGKSIEEFNAEQTESLDAAAEAFRTQQKEKLRQIAAPAVAPVTAIPAIPATPAPSN